jgi:putative ABC transport system permease protein
VKDDTDVIAVTVSTNMKVSGVMLIEGEKFDPDSEDGIWLSDQYASKNGVSVGDELTLVYKNIEIGAE